MEGTLDSSTGVYMGSVWQEYPALLGALHVPDSVHVLTGSGMNFMVGRVSYTFGLQGGPASCLCLDLPAGTISGATGLEAGVFASQGVLWKSPQLAMVWPHPPRRAVPGSGVCACVQPGPTPFGLVSARGRAGPCIGLDTACSSSLVATHLAHRGLLDGETSAALASGVNLMLVASTTTHLAQLGALSPNGRSKSFDASADGYGRGEACISAVLRLPGEPGSHAAVAILLGADPTLPLAAQQLSRPPPCWTGCHPIAAECA